MPLTRKVKYKKPYLCSLFSRFTPYIHTLLSYIPVPYLLTHRLYLCAIQDLLP